jgi:hypothetical protein
VAKELGHLGPDFGRRWRCVALTFGQHALGGLGCTLIWDRDACDVGRRCEALL